MSTIGERIVQELRTSGPLDDDALAQRLDVRPRQSINQAARRLANQGLLARSRGPSGKILNLLSEQVASVDVAGQSPTVMDEKGPIRTAAKRVHQSELMLGDVAFRFAGAIDADRDPSGSLVLDEPHLRFENAYRLGLHDHGSGPFARLRLTGLPDVPGIYAVVLGSGDLMYLGRARDSIKRRWGPAGYAVIHPRNCFTGGQSTNCRMNRLMSEQLSRGADLGLWVHEIDDPTALETSLISSLRPPWNVRL